jgi:hypothetical protein
MTHPQNSNAQPARHLQTALEHASRLSDPRSGKSFTPGWSAEAAHVGDLSVLVLALRH